MNQQNTGRSTFDFFFILSLLGIFVLTASLAIMIGGTIYKKTVYTMEADSSSRTALSYLCEKLRQSDRQGTIELADDSHTGTQLRLHNTWEADPFITYIYTRKGTLCELTVRAADPPDYAAGQTISRIDGFSVSLRSNGLYEITVFPTDGKELSAYVAAKTQ